jgi:hypothetical protein
MIPLVDRDTEAAGLVPGAQGGREEAGDGEDGGRVSDLISLLYLTVATCRSSPAILGGWK